MNRRQFLRLLAAGGVGLYNLDIDRLLWVPGQKTIFLPTKSLITESSIISAEYERIIPHIKMLFERDNMFYHLLDDNTEISTSRPIHIPMEIKKK